MKDEKFMYETVSQGRVCEYEVYFKGEHIATTFDNQANGDYSILMSDSSGYLSYKIFENEVYLHCCMEGKYGMKDKNSYHHFKDGEWIEDKSVERFFNPEYIQGKLNEEEMKKNNSFKEGIMQLCTINGDEKFISLEDWTSDEVNNDKYNIEFFDIVEIKETGYNKNFPSELFFKATLENGDILNIAGDWYDDNTINISYKIQEKLKEEEKTQTIDELIKEKEIELDEPTDERVKGPYCVREEDTPVF